MRPWIRRTFIGLFSATLLTGGLAAYGHGRHWGGPMTEADAQKMRERMVDKVTRELSLDAAQQQRLNVLADALRAQRVALMGATGAAGADTGPRAELQALIAGNTFDRTRAQRYVDGKLEAVRTQSPAVITALGDFYDGLRPDQQQKVREFLARRHNHRHGG